jgi:tagatose-1,6-bisphosphate aldolase
MTPIGRIRGIRACASERGTFTLLAVDHRQNLRKALRPDDPDAVEARELIEFKQAVVGALAREATGVLLDPEYGAAQCIIDGSLPGATGLIVAIESTGYVGASTDRLGGILDGWSVEKARRMGASAVKLLVYYHPEAAHAAAQERLVAEVAAQCAEQDLPLFLEPLAFSIDPKRPLTGRERGRIAVETARRLTPIGGDILKAEFPGDVSAPDPSAWLDAAAELSEASRVPWVLLSAGVDEVTFLAQVDSACRGGASGIAAGRVVWAEAPKLPPTERDVFLASTARRRLRELAELVGELGRPWHTVPTALSATLPPSADWFRGY